VYKNTTICLNFSYERKPTIHRASKIRMSLVCADAKLPAFGDGGDIILNRSLRIGTY